jgi:ubiquitin C-terminal hydrolase
MRNLYTKEDKKSYAPKEFKELIGNMNSLFRGINANDSKDLILFLYEKIHEELNVPNNYNNTEQNIPYDLLQFRQNYYSLNSSIIEKTFYSEQITIYQCENCKNETTNYGIQNILIFPLEKIRINLARTFPKGYICVNLEDCFKELCQPEYMQGENKMYCNNCGIQSDAKYFTKMNNCPEVMTIILNRGKGNEFDVEFDFPFRIDINNYVIYKNRCTIYDLIGVLVHTGGNDMSGHFFAFCKSNIDNNWYIYNDSFVSKCDDNYAYKIKNTGLPYVLFYQNIDCINNNNTNNNSNSNINNNDEMITLYFKTINGKEIYLDVNSNDSFGKIIQILANKYNNNYYDYMKSNYFIITLEGKQYLDINKTVKENNLSNFSYIIIG